MPAHEASLRLTESYRARMLALRARGQSVAEAGWGNVSIADLDGTFAAWLAGTTASVADLQRQAVRLSRAYLQAFKTLELGRAAATPIFDSAPYVGVSRDGRPLAEAYNTARIAVLGAIGGQIDPLRAGRDRALRAVGLDVDQAARQSLTDAMAKDPQIAGWRRAVKGTCDACLGLAIETLSPPGTPLEIHPGCQCVSEPALKGVLDSVPRPSGAELFAAMAPTEQDGLFGKDKAALLRTRQITLAECVDHSRLETAPDFITAKPLKNIPAAKAGGPNQ